MSIQRHIQTPTAALFVKAKTGRKPPLYNDRRMINTIIPYDGTLPSRKGMNYVPIHTTQINLKVSMLEEVQANYMDPLIKFQDFTYVKHT